MYRFGGLQISVKGQQAIRKEAQILVVAPHTTFIDAILIHVTKLSCPLVRNHDQNLGSKSH